MIQILFPTWLSHNGLRARLIIYIGFRFYFQRCPNKTLITPFKCLTVCAALWNRMHVSMTLTYCSMKESIKSLIVKWPTRGFTNHIKVMKLVSKNKPLIRLCETASYLCDKRKGGSNTTWNKMGEGGEEITQVLDTNHPTLNSVGAWMKKRSQ